MIQDAINTLANLLSQFNDSFSMEILPDGSINLFYQKIVGSDETELETFNNVEAMVEWMEKNLEKAK